MGFCPSHYTLIQGGLQVNRIVAGKRSQKNNAYQCDNLLQNLPFAEIPNGFTQALKSKN